MTELETLQRAKMYLDKLANGIDPLTDSAVPDNECINQVRISRCLFYVSDILRKLIENGGIIEKSQKRKKIGFTITPEELNKYQIDDKPIPVSEITKRINDLVDLETMSKLRHTSITSFLLKSGLLVEQEFADGKKYIIPTEKGKSIGISREERQAHNNRLYYVTVYNADAQRFILENIHAIIELNNFQNESAELQGKPWTSNYDEALIDLYGKHVPIFEIAVTLKRTETEILERLTRLGIIKQQTV
jgi:predicted transcriptional regulator